MAELMLDKFGKIDILVNNAGVMAGNKLTDTSLADWNRVINTDLTGVFLCTRSVLPSMISHKQGRIINISSTLGLIGGRQQAAYSAAKGGVIAFTRASARELAQYGIAVNCVAPGPTETDALVNASPEIREAFRKATLIGRYCSPEEVARTVVFLASSDGGAFFGQILCPNNGEFMG
jgi:3-oxoacyl-[acyl-carrier protein] reductase